MAKIRVYELARELNLTNKLLLEKIRELDIPVKTHMSALESSAVATIKDHLFSKKKVEEIREIRVKSTVIRRRRKVVSPEVDEESLPGQDEDEESPTSPEAAPSESSEAVHKDEKKSEDETEEAPPTEPLKKKEKTASKSVAKRKKITTPRETPAKILRSAKSPPSEPTPADTLPEESADPDKPATSKPVGEAALAEARGLKVVSEATEDQPEKKTEAPKTAKKKTVKKPVKKKPPREAPAKIIRMGVPVKKTPRPPGRAPVSPIPGTGTGPAADKPDKARRRRKKGKSPETGQDAHFFKKRITFKRKEVIEGAALYSRRRSRKRQKQARGKTAAVSQKTQITTAKAIKRRVKVEETIALSELAKKMGIKANEMIAKLMTMGVMATVNQVLDFETASLIASEFEYEIEKTGFEEDTILRREKDESPDELVHRPPVITIMGHVDHGKTSLLDVIRKTRVTEMEAGGITQHIGAYHVKTEQGELVFLDTPGHEAFTAMRSRGAGVTDIVVLVVAADDGVMPQTVEAINHSKVANVPIIVAVNKIDKTGAEPERVQRQLAELDLTPEDWGGDTIFVQVSAKQNTGIDQLLEMIVLQAELLELKANPDKLAVARVVEAKLDTGRGPMVTVLINEGTLRAGDSVVCGVHHGKVRSLINDRGRQIDSAGPAMPVEILGLSGVPEAGDELVVLSDEKDAKQVSLHRTQKMREKELAKTSRVSMENLFDKMKSEEVKELNLVLKADVHGSIEALRDSLIKLSNDEVNINIVHAATGTINESDVPLAAVSNAIIIGFNVRPTSKVQALATEENVDMRFYSVIYNVIKDIKDAIGGMMASIFEEKTIGRAEVREIFTVPKVGTIAGSYVTDGAIRRREKARVLRDGVIVYEGKISSLKRFKDDAKEVQTGYECGIGIENFNDIKVEDVIECFQLEETRPELD